MPRASPRRSTRRASIVPPIAPERTRNSAGRPTPATSTGSPAARSPGIGPRTTIRARRDAGTHTSPSSTDPASTTTQEASPLPAGSEIATPVIVTRPSPSVSPIEVEWRAAARPPRRMSTTAPTVPRWERTTAMTPVIAAAPRTHTGGRAAPTHTHAAPATATPSIPVGVPRRLRARAPSHAVQPASPRRSPGRRAGPRRR